MDPISFNNFSLAKSYDATSGTTGSSRGTDNSGAPKVATGGTMDMNTFLQLLAAQFQNQDVTNPTDNTEFISELAQFSSLQAMNTVAQYQDSQYGASLVGKTVLVAKYNDKGQLVKDTGVVQSVSFSSSDGSSISVNGNDYALGSVMQVINPDSGATPPTDGGDSTGSNGDTSGAGGQT